MDTELRATENSSDSPDPIVSSEAVEGRNDASTASSAEHERWSRLPKPRGRQPRNPHAQTVRFSCRDTDDMENSLRDYLKAPSELAEHTTLEFVFPVSAAFMVYAADFKNVKKQSTAGEKQPTAYGKLDRTAISVIDALAASEDPKDQMRRQKSIAKVCVEACEKADGYRYSFHNNWLSREDEACRFSYFCNDSTLNKGRAANEGAGMLGKKMRKPAYDCQGVIAVKFSATKQRLEVHYKHVPLHKTYEERAPPPRKHSNRGRALAIATMQLHSPKQSKKRKSAIVEGFVKVTPKRRRVTEPVAISSATEIVDLTREDSLQPLVEFLGSANVLQNGGTSVQHTQVVSRKDNIPGASLENVFVGPGTTEKNVRLKFRKPLIPGTMAGSVKRGHLDWTHQSSRGSKPPAQDVHQPAPKLPIPRQAHRTITLAPSNAAATALSELEALKRKLQEAEDRIKRLESEKTTKPPPMYGPPPPQHVLWPPHPAYPNQPLQQYSQYRPLPMTSAYPPIQPPSHPAQMQFQPPPQRSLVPNGPTQGQSTPSAQMPDPSINPSPVPPVPLPATTAKASAPSTTPGSQPTVTKNSKPAKTNPQDRKFVTYKPGAKSKHNGK